MALNDLLKEVEEYKGGTTSPLSSTRHNYWFETANISASQIEAFKPVQDNQTVLSYLCKASESEGNVVQFNVQMGYLPFLSGNDNRPVLLYQFVESIEDHVDYEALRRDHPTLSYMQIVGALGYLRKIAQFNVYGHDIDEIEDSMVEGSREFQEAIRTSLQNGEKRLVPLVQQRTSR